LILSRAVAKRNLSPTYIDLDPSNDRAEAPIIGISNGTAKAVPFPDNAIPQQGAVGSTRLEARPFPWFDSQPGRARLTVVPIRDRG
jgi:hypothetical protein